MNSDNAYDLQATLAMSQYKMRAGLVLLCDGMPKPKISDGRWVPPAIKGVK
jgi:hypothetical protein